jgi:hypothetical protein
MNKTLEAFLRGYLFFDVNGKKFFTYNAAREERVRTVGDVEFKGWHIFKGWRCFFLSVGGRNE